jgi:hypothetical protein
MDRLKEGVEALFPPWLILANTRSEVSPNNSMKKPPCGFSFALVYIDSSHTAVINDVFCVE